MKIILAPSKTQEFTGKELSGGRPPQYLEEATKLRQQLSSMSMEDLGQVLKIKGKMLDQVYSMYQREGSLPGHAIYSYTGAVYKQLRVKDYDNQQLEYAEDVVRILSAMYGVLRPLDLIEGYRLDMTHKPMGESLYTYWQEPMKILGDEELIINLASKEFSKMIKSPMITLSFKENKGGVYKTVGTYAKMARGKYLDYMITHGVRDIDAIKSMALDGYDYNEELSSEYEFLFTR